MRHALHFLAGLGLGALLLSLLILLSGCATKRYCVQTACGDICCNDDGKVCPTCREENHEAGTDDHED